MTSTRGCVRRAGGTILKPVTCEDALSQSGATPMSAKAWARSSPPVRMVALAQRSMTIALRPVAMILDMAVQYLLGRALTYLPGGARRHRARIDPVKITPRGEHVDASARRRAARAGRDKAAIERGKERSAFRFPAAIDECAYSRGYIIPSARFVARWLKGLGERGYGRISQARLRRLPENMQAIGDPHVLQIAKPGIEVAQGNCWTGAVLQPAILK